MPFTFRGPSRYATVRERAEYLAQCCPSRTVANRHALTDPHRTRTGFPLPSRRSLGQRLPFGDAQEIRPDRCRRGPRSSSRAPSCSSPPFANRTEQTSRGSRKVGRMKDNPLCFFTYGGVGQGRWCGSQIVIPRGKSIPVTIACGVDGTPSVNVTLKSPSPCVAGPQPLASQMMCSSRK